MPIDHSLQISAAPTQPAMLYPTLPHTAMVSPTLPRYMFIIGGAGAAPTTQAGEPDRDERIQQAAAALDGQVEREASPFGDGMTYTICQLPTNGAAARLATVMRNMYATGVRTVALPRSRHLYDRA